MELALKKMKEALELIKTSAEKLPATITREQAIAKAQVYGMIAEEALEAAEAAIKIWGPKPA